MLGNVLQPSINVDVVLRDDATFQTSFYHALHNRHRCLDLCACFRSIAFLGSSPMSGFPMVLWCSWTTIQSYSMDEKAKILSLIHIHIGSVMSVIF